MKRCLAALLALLCWPLMGLGETKTITKFTDAYFATLSVLAVPVEANDFDTLWQETKAILGEVERCVSVAEPTSDVARFNALAQGESCPVSDTTAEIFQLAQRVWVETDGLYDPTVYPLVDLWGFSPRFNQNRYEKQYPYDRSYENGVLPLPETADIDALLALVGLEGVVLEGESGAWILRKLTPDIELDGTAFHAQMDLGGVAKGYACDRVTRMLQEHGIQNGYFTCGGSSMGILESLQSDRQYEMAIGKPRPGKTAQTSFASVRTKNTGLSTSSDQNHCRVVDGVVYCHIIDPRTGWPVNCAPNGEETGGIVSATLMGASAARCDAMTTALMLMGAKEAEAFLNAQDEMRGLFVVAQAGETRYEVRDNLRMDEVEMTDPAYERVKE